MAYLGLTENESLEKLTRHHDMTEALDSQLAPLYDPKRQQYLEQGLTEELASKRLRLYDDIIGRDALKVISTIDKTAVLDQTNFDNLQAQTQENLTALEQGLQKRLQTSQSHLKYYQDEIASKQSKLLQLQTDIDTALKNKQAQLRQESLSKIESLGKSYVEPLIDSLIELERLKAVDADLVGKITEKQGSPALSGFGSFEGCNFWIAVVLGAGAVYLWKKRGQ